ncbi:MAG: HDOD domain-containing protein [Gammaproteobacteria bacterium]|nr:HDOD domain-containing protein [Gammaproteobacteria bacterium]
MNQQFTEFQQKLVEDFRAGKIGLPSMPSAVLQIRDALYNQNLSFEEIDRIIQIDPALVVTLIHVANSPFYRGESNITSCKGALSRLGLGTTRNIVTSIVLRSAFQSGDPRARKLLLQAWRQSCHVAAICHVLAQFTDNIRSDRAMLAGLIHNIGTLPILNHLLKTPDLLKHPKELQQLLHKLQGLLGRQLLRHWEFDPELCVIPVASSNRDYDSGKDEIDLTDVVVTARQYVILIRNRTPESEERFCITPSFQKISSDWDSNDEKLSFIDNEEQQISEMISTLSS